MSEMEDRKRKKAYQLDHMSTEELEELLKTYSLSPEDTDMDIIFSILEVIEKREKSNPSGKYIDVDSAWATFQQHYRPVNKQTESIYNYTEDIANNVILHSDINGPKDKYTERQIRRPIKHKALLRIACVLVLLIVVLLSGTIVAKAFGFDVWGAVAKWTSETFGFSSSVSEFQGSQDLKGQIEYKSLQNALDKYKITAKLAPTWLPNEYALKSVNVTETPAKTTFFANYKSDSDEIAIIVTSYVNPSTRTYEKDNEAVTVYSKGGIQHYIISNLDQTQVVWQTENFECSISGNYSIDEAKKMIDSIYERISQ